MKHQNIFIVTFLGVIYGFYLFVTYLAANPNVDSAYKMFYLDKKLRNWSNGLNASYQLGGLIDFSRKVPYLSREGWSTHDLTGTWSNGKSSEIFLRIGKSNAPTEILFYGQPFLFPDSGLNSQTINFFINGKRVGSYTLFMAEEVTLKIPPEIFSNSHTVDLLRIRLEYPNAAVPRNLGQSSDTRTLGVFFSKMIVR